MFNAGKHPRGWHGWFSPSGQVDRAASPHAVSGGRLQVNATKTKAGKRRLTIDEAGPVSVAEGPMFLKTGKAKTASRFSGGRKSTIKFNTPAVDLVDGKLREVNVPRKRIPWKFDMSVRPGSKNYDSVSRSAEANSQVASAKTDATYKAALANQAKVERDIRSAKALAKGSRR